MQILPRNRLLLVAIAVCLSVASTLLITNWLQLRSRSNPKFTDSAQTQVIPATETTAFHTVASKSTDPPVVPVRMYRIGSPGGHSRFSRFTGTVRPRYESAIAFRVGGKVSHRLVEVGQSVKRGEILFELDAEDFRLQHKTAEANLLVANASSKQATAEEGRLADLRRYDAISQSEYERALLSRDVASGQQTSAQRQLELANNQLAYCRLVADMDGIITSLQAEAGQVVAVGSPVCVIAGLKQLEAVIDVPENASSLPIGLPVQVEYWSLPKLRSTGVLREISPIANPITRTYRARFSIDQPPVEVHLGMTTTVSWDVQSMISALASSHTGSVVDSKAGTAISIPASAIIRDGETTAVWVATPTETDPDIYVIAAQPVEVGAYGDQSIDVIQGLSTGQFIVSAGVQKLDSGMRVRMWELQK